jgi:hypothetical protein
VSRVLYELQCGSSGSALKGFHESAIRAFKGTEYTISGPRDLWLSTSVKSKRQRAVATSSTATGTH